MAINNNGSVSTLITPTPVTTGNSEMTSASTGAGSSSPRASGNRVVSNSSLNELRQSGADTTGRTLQASVSSRSGEPPVPTSSEVSTSKPFFSRLKQAKKTVSKAAERRFVSSTGSSTLGVQVSTQTGRPVKLANTGGERTSLPAAPTPPLPGSVPIPAVEPKFGKSQQAKIDSAIAGVFSSDKAQKKSLLGNVLGAIRNKVAGAPPKESMAGFPTSLSEISSSVNASRVYISSLFAGKGNEAEHTQFHAKLEAALPLTPGSERQVLGQRAVLAEIMAGVCLYPADAAKALDSLTRNHFLPTEAPDAQMVRPQLHALLTAQSLISTGPGQATFMAALKHPVDEAMQEPMLHLIGASAQIAKETPPMAYKGFHDIKAHAEAVAGTDKDTLACRVLRAASKVAEARRPAGEVLNRAEKTEVFTWRQGFREEGKNTPLGKTMSRLAKFRKYADRAEHYHSITHTNFDVSQPLKSTGAVLKSTMQAVAHTTQRATGHKKSPFLGIHKHGLGHAALQHPHKDVVLLDGHMHTAIQQLQQHLGTAVGTHATALQRQPDVTREQLAALPPLVKKRNLPAKLGYKLTHNKVAKALAQPFRSSQSARDKGPAVPDKELQLAIVSHWEQHSQTQRPDGVKLTDVDVRMISARIYQSKLQDARASQPGIPDAQLQLSEHDQAFKPTNATLPAQLTKLVGKTLDHALLGQLAERFDVPMQTTPASENEQAGETAFASSMRKAGAIVAPESNTAKSLHSDDMETLLTNYIMEHNGGNSVTFADGGIQGANTSVLGLGLTLSKRNKLSVGPVADVRFTHAKSAVFSIGTSSVVGGEIFLGTQRQVAGQLGGGASATLKVGVPKRIMAAAKTLHHLSIGKFKPFHWIPALDAHASIGGSVTANLIGMDHTHSVGVRLRTVTQRDAAGNMASAAIRPQMADQLHYMFDSSRGDKRQLSANEMWQDFANHYFDSKNVSVSWQDYKSHSAKSGFGISGNARAGFKLSSKITIKPGITAGVTATKTWRNNTDRKEQSGSAPIMRSDRAQSYEVNLTLGANIASVPIDPKLPGTMHGDPNSLSASVPIKSATYQLLNGGFSAMFRTVMENGNFNEVFTVRDIGHRNVNDFLKMVNEPSRRQEWEALCTAASGGDPEAGKARLDSYIQHVQDYARPGQTYSMRSRIRSEPLGELMNAWASFKTAETNGKVDVMMSRMEDIAQILIKPENWVANAMFTMHTNSRQDSTGLNFVAQLQAQTTTSTDRELEFVGMPIAIADAWAKVMRPEAEGASATARQHSGQLPTIQEE